MSRHLSLPHEHGAGITAAGAAIAAVAVAPAPLPALGVGLAVVAAFFARGAVDRLAARTPLRDWDRVALVSLGVLAVAGSALAAVRAPVFGAVTLALCAGMLAASAAVRRSKAHRAVVFEWLGLAGLGASAGLGALAGGAALTVAAGVALVIAGHAAVAVPLVRTEVRKRERSGSVRALVIAAGGLAACAALVLALTPPSLALALTPRAGYLVYRAALRPEPPRAAIVGLRETVLLLCCVLIAGLAAGSHHPSQVSGGESPRRTRSSRRDDLASPRSSAQVRVLELRTNMNPACAKVRTFSHGILCDLRVLRGEFCSGRSDES